MPVTPSCPRCGYDLSGLASSWQDTCPLHGQCSECGLSLRWAEVLNPTLTVPHWSFEHAIAGRRMGRLVHTWSRALRPATFWRMVRLEHPIVARRLAILMLVLAAASHAVAYGLVFWARYERSFGWWESPAKIAVECLWPYSLGNGREFLVGNWFIFSQYTMFGFAHWFVFAWFLLTPFTFLVLTDTFRRIRVRFIHLFRAGVYSLSAIPLMVALSLFVEASSLGPLRNVGWSGTSELAEWLMGAVLVLGAVWLVRFWWIVPREYLRLPHAGAVSVMMLVVSGLGALVVTVLLIVWDFKV